MRFEVDTSSEEYETVNPTYRTCSLCNPFQVILDRLALEIPGRFQNS